MSEHDPFDGQYDETPAAPHAAEAEQADEPAEKPEPTVFTHGHLERMSKAELRSLAQERDLDGSGNREVLISRIEAAQRG